MVRDAYPLILIFGPLAIVTFIWGWWVAGSLFLLLTLFVAYFFRDPQRQIPPEKGIIVSPADGKVVRIAQLDPSDQNSPTLVSIFLSPLDVHINRAPIGGQIADVSYTRGKFKPATQHESSLVNEQNVITIKNDRITVIFKQIAGILARRIVFWKRMGDRVAIGERVGLIKFGSRTDIIIPPEATLTISVGERVRGGVSIIGRYEP